MLEEKQRPFGIGDTILPIDMRVGDIVRPQYGMQGAFIDCVVIKKDDKFVHLYRPYAFLQNSNPYHGVENYPIEITSESHKFTLLNNRYD